MARRPAVPIGVIVVSASTILPVATDAIHRAGDQQELNYVVTGESLVPAIMLRELP